MSAQLLVVGSVAFDDIETRAGKREEILGGAAVYIALSARHFCDVALVGVVGEGDFPDEHVSLLTARGVDVSGLARAPGRTFRWSGVYAADFSSRRTIRTELGVFERFDPEIPRAHRASRFLLLGNIHPALQLRVLDAMDEGCFVATDTMNLWIETTRAELVQVISRTDLLVINDEESLLLTGEPQIAVAAERILAMGPRCVVIKRGEHGAWLFDGGRPFFAPAMPLLEVVDPTGAGDSFAGGLLGHLAGAGSTGPADIRRGMVHGAAVASASVQGFGVERIAAIDRGWIDERFEELRRLVEI
ncbi:MAG TPA: PfkB family carbohydrate kinase [Polyangia bacterium]|nr:PfkB family carbohydrate kinase [Polyangia bacterium]